MVKRQDTPSQHKGSVKKQRHPSMHRNLSVALLRVFATLAIVLQHSAQLYFGDTSVIDPTLGPPKLFYLVRYIASFSVPIFVFISGYLYYLMRVERQKYDDYEKFVKSKFKRLIIPFYLFAFLYFIPAKWLLGLYETSELSGVFFTQITAGGQNVVWFLFMLFWVYTIFYLIESSLNKTRLAYVVAILGILSIVSGYFTTTLQIQTVLTYSIYFFLGYQVRSKHRIFEKYSLVWSPILFLLHFSLFVLIYRINIFKEFPILQIALLLLSLLGVFTAYFAANIIASKVNFEKWRGFLFLDRNSLLVYLLHEPIILIFLYFYAQRIDNYYVIAGLSMIIGLILSCILAAIATKWGRFRDLFYSSAHKMN